MKNLENKDFEEQWRKAFADASENPPKLVWERIEAELDKEERRLRPFAWWNRWQVWTAAASLTALLLVGWWAINHNNTEQISIATQTHKSSKNSDYELNRDSDSFVRKSKNIDAKTATNENPVLKEPISRTDEKSEIASIAPKNRKPQENAILSRKHFTNSNKNTDIALFKKSVSDKSTANNVTTINSSSSTIASNNNSVSATIASDFPAISSPNTFITNSLSITAINVEALQHTALRKLFGIAKPQIWVAYNAPLSELPKSNAKRQFWTAFGIMPASFNAGVGIGGRNAAATFASAGQDGLARTAVLESPNDRRNNRSAFSYAVQYQGGIELNERWSLESGIGYLQGNSTFEAVNGFNPLSNSYINSLEAAITLSDISQKNQVSKSFLAQADQNQPQSLITPQSVSNSYQYLQVPVQTGFAVVKPKRKFSMTLLGGFINNIFLRNSFQTGQERMVTINNSESPYKTISWAATTGVRVQYRLSNRWASVLTGNYQYSIGSTTRSSALFAAHPQLFGISAGLRYGL